MPTPTIEEYLEMIYALSEDGGDVIGARLAEALDVSPPTVTATLQRMVRDGLVDVGAHKEVTLTANGRQAVEGIVRRHRLSERFLIDMLGLDWDQVHEEACRLEHAISPLVEERLARLLGDPETCPHGNPIPGKAKGEREQRLVDAVEGETYLIQRVAQRGESERGLLHYLAERGLLPGVVVTVEEVAPFNGPVVLDVNGRKVPVSRDVAAMLWVSKRHN